MQDLNDDLPKSPIVRVGQNARARAVARTYLTITNIIKNLNVLLKKYYRIRKGGRTHTHGQASFFKKNIWINIKIFKLLTF